VAYIAVSRRERMGEGAECGDGENLSVMM